jgi:hypothetical protein
MAFNGKARGADAGFLIYRAERVILMIGVENRRPLSDDGLS